MTTLHHRGRLHRLQRNRNPQGIKDLGDLDALVAAIIAHRPCRTSPRNTSLTPSPAALWAMTGAELLADGGEEQI